MQNTLEICTISFCYIVNSRYNENLHTTNETSITVFPLEITRYNEQLNVVLSLRYNEVFF